MENRDCGSITVFLVLISVILLALVGSTLESARISYAKAIGQRGLMSATEALLTEYYAPLYEDYHVFFLEKGIDTDTLETDKLLQTIQEYLIYTLEPNKDITLLNTEYVISNTNLSQIMIKDMEIEEIVRVVDKQGEAFIQEANEYMKHKIPENLLEEFLTKLNIFQKADKTSKVIEKKLSAEEGLGELNENIMEIIELIEGIAFGKKGLLYTKKNLLKVKENFAKRLCYGKITNSNVSIYHDLVWNSLKSHYINTKDILEKININSNYILKCRKEIEEYEEELQSYEELQNYEELRSYKELQGYGMLQIFKEKPIKKQEIEKEKIEENNSLEQEKEEIKKKKEALRKKIQELESDIQITSKEIKEKIKDLVNISRKTKEKAELALEKIPPLKEKQKKAEKKLEEFQTSLAQNKEEIEESIYIGLEEERVQMKQYNENALNHILDMQPILEQNIKVLETYIALSDFISTNHIKLANNTDILKFQSDVFLCMEVSKLYNIKLLSFDYESLKLKSDVENPLDTISELMKKGILELVIENAEKISDKTIEESDKLWKQYKNIEEIEKTEEKDNDFGDMLENANDKGYSSDITDSFGTFEKGYNSITDKFTEQLLWNEYIKLHFKDFRESIEENNRELEKENREIEKSNKKAEEYNKTIEKSSRKTEKNNKETEENMYHVLEYETEYILKGKSSDIDNLTAVMNQIIFIRTIFNFMYLLSDKEKGNLAYGTAAALVGFTGLEPLVRITKTLILLAWAFEESIIDVAALFAGEKVAIVKTKDTFMVRFEEIILFNKQLIQQKIEKISKNNQSTVSLSYQDYLNIFLLIEKQEKKVYRTMDLIERNIQSRYHNGFSIERCIYSIKVCSTYHIPAKFIQLPFVKKMVGNREKGWKVESVIQCAY